MSIKARVVDILAWIVGTLVLKIAFPKLAENAVTGWVDDKIGEILGLSAPDISTVFGWVWPAVLMVLILWFYHQFYRRVPTPSGSSPGFAGMLNGPSLQYWIGKVDPTYVIAVGLVIAFGGTIWLWTRDRPSQAIPEISKITTPVPDSKADLATKPSALHFSRSEKDEMIEELSKVQKTLSARIFPTHNKSVDRVSAMLGAGEFAGPSTLEPPPVTPEEAGILATDLSNYAQEVTQQDRKWLADLGKNPGLKPYLSGTIPPDDDVRESYRQTMVQLASVFGEASSLQKTYVPSIYFDAQRAAFRNARFQYEAWLRRANDELGRKITELRQ